MGARMYPYLGFTKHGVGYSDGRPATWFYRSSVLDWRRLNAYMFLPTPQLRCIPWVSNGDLLNLRVYG